MPGLSTDEIERTSRGKARALSCPLAVRTYQTGVKALPCQSRADDGYGWFAPKPCERIGREQRLCHVKAVGDDDYGWFSPKPCRRWLWLGRAKAVRAMTMAGSRQSRVDDGYGWVAPKPCGRWIWLGRAKAVRTMTMAGSRQSRADKRTGQEAEAKMGVILVLRRYRSGS